MTKPKRVCNRCHSASPGVCQRCGCPEFTLVIDRQKRIPFKAEGKEKNRG